MIINLPKLGPVQFADDLSEEDFQKQLQALSKKYDFKLPKPEVGLGTLFKQGLMRGIGQTGIALGDVGPAMLASFTGFPEYAEQQMQEAAETQQKLEQKYPTQFKSYTEVESPYEALQFGAETLGEVTPTIGTSIISGGLGGVGARALATRGVGQALAARAAEKELTEEATKKLVERGTQLLSPQISKTARQGMYGGTFFGSFAQNAPEVFQNIYEETGEFEPVVSALAGGISAVLDSFVPASILDKFGSYGRTKIIEKLAKESGAAPRVWKAIGKEAAKAAAGEGITESAQEAISAAAEEIAGSAKGLFDPENIQRYKEAFVKGAVGGAGFGSISGLRRGLDEREAYKKKFGGKQPPPAAEEVSPVVPTGVPTAPIAPPGVLTPEAEEKAIADFLEQLNREAEAEAAAQAAPTEGAPDVTRTDEQAGREGVGVSGEGVAGATAGTAGEAKPSGVDTAGSNADESVGREGEKPGALETAPTEVAPAPKPAAQVFRNVTPEEKTSLNGLIAFDHNGRTFVISNEGGRAETSISNPRGDLFADEDTWTVRSTGDKRANILYEGKPFPKDISPKVAGLLTELSKTQVTDAPRINTLLGQLQAEITPKSVTSKAAPAPQAEESEFVGLPEQTETPNYADMSLDELRQVRESADEINDALDLAAIRKHMGEEVAAAYEKMNRRQRMKWWEKNDLVAMEQDSSAFKGVDEELIDEYINAYNNFDTESPRDLGRSIALAAREADKPNFASSPEYVRLRNAFNYAKEQGWSSDEVLEGMRGKAKEWAGRDAGELFGRLFKAVTEAPGIKEVTTEQRQAELPAPKPTAPKELPLTQAVKGALTPEQRNLAETGNLKGLLQNLLDQAQGTFNLGSVLSPARREVASILRRMLSVDTGTKLVVGTPTGKMALPVFSKFYSALGRGVEGINIKSATPQGWKDAIKGLVNKGQVKQEEVEWTGINDWLGLQEGRVSKEQVVDYLKNNGVQVEEVVLGGRQEWRVRLDLLENRGLPNLNRQEREEYLALLERRDREGRLRDEDMPAKFQEYTLPGGENYREVLLTLPTRLVPDMSPEWRGSVDREVDARTGAEPYRSQHWEQPNIIAHIRVNDRTDADGKRVLFVEEIQSDWGQEGKKRGFDAPPKRKTKPLAEGEFDDFITRMKEAAAQSILKNDGITQETARIISNSQPLDFVAEQAGMIEEYREMLARMDEDRATEGQLNRAGIPSAPFVTKTEGWLNLALKKVMIMAAEGGYDRVAFINGEQSADRYDLSRQVDNIFSGNNGDGTWAVSATKDGNTVFKDDRLPQDKLADTFGKEIAEKIISSKDGIRLSGVDLKVGGEGMKAFYDQIVPAAVKKLLPKVGGGQMAAVPFPVEKPWAAVKQGETWSIVKDNFVVRSGFESYADALRAGNREFGDRDTGALDKTQLGFDVTPEMRSVVETKGVPLFYGKAGSYDPATNTIMLDPNNGLNAHTLVHEASHALLSHTLDNPSHPVTKEVTNLYNQMKASSEGAYGATDVQEFAAEAWGNPEFRDHLRQFKPTGQKLDGWKRLINALRRLFGFGSNYETAYDKLDNLLSQIISPAPESRAGETLYAQSLDTPNFGAAVGRQLDNTLSKIGALDPKKVAQVWAMLEKLSNPLRSLFYKSLNLYGLGNVGTRYFGDKSMKFSDLFNEMYGAETQLLERMKPLHDRLTEHRHKNPELHAELSKLATDATKEDVRPYDEAKNMYDGTPKAITWKKLNDRFNDLKRRSPETTQLYRDVFATFKALQEEFKKSLRQGIEATAKDSATALSAYQKIMQELASMEIDHYIPLYREGSYWLTYAVNGIPTTRLFKTDAERKAARAQAEANGAVDIEEFSRADQFRERNVPDNTMLASIMKIMKDSGAQKEDLDKLIHLVVSTFPETSILKSRQHRKGVAGYMDDNLALVFDKVTSRSARQIARLRYRKKLRDVLDEMYGDQAKLRGDASTDAKNMLEEFEGRYEFGMNPNLSLFSQFASSGAFFFNLAANVSSAVVQTMQVPMVVYPMLGGKYGFTDAWSALQNAYGLYSTSGLTRVVKGLDGRETTEKSMLSIENRVNRGDKEVSKYSGLIEALKNHGLLYSSTARDALSSENANDSGYGGVNKLWRVTTQVSSFMQHHSERMNREVTALAAYDLEMNRLKKNKTLSPEQKEAKAIQEALRMVEYTHGAGSTMTGPSLGQSDIGKVLMVFKRFAFSMYYMLFDTMFRALPVRADATQEEKDAAKAARMQLVGIYGMAAIFAGAKGIPMYWIAELAYNTLRDDDEDDFDAVMRAFLGDFLYKGPVNYFTNLSIADRVGWADLIWRENKGSRADASAVTQTMESILGAPYSVIKNIGSGFNQIAEGHFYRGVETMLPAVLKNVLKGGRYALEGANTLRGDPVMGDINGYNAAMQVLGFAPADLMKQYEENAYILGKQDAILQKQTRLMKQYYTAVRQNDFDRAFELREKLFELGDKYPELQINDANLNKKVKSRDRISEKMYHGVQLNDRLRARLEGAAQVIYE